MKFLRRWIIFCAIFTLPLKTKAAFLAAAGKVDITPDIAREKTYLAGYGFMGRKVKGVHDPLYARILILSDKKMTLAIVSLDLIGFFRNQVKDLRKLSGFAKRGRYLFVASTHDHSGPDTLGLWGPWPGVSGVSPTYINRIEASIADKIKDLSQNLKPAKLSGFTKELSPNGLCQDSRDPVVIDPYLSSLHVQSLNGKTIAILIHWPCHAEALSHSNHFLTADFPGALCSEVEKKSAGTCLFINGPIGGLLTPEEISNFDPWTESKRIGKSVADFALRNLPQAIPIKGAIRVQSKLILIPIQNSRYLLFLQSLVFGHRLLLSDGKPIGQSPFMIALKHAFGFLKPEESPWIRSEVSFIQIGSMAILGIPGEIFPELVIGGYHGRYRFGHPLIKPENPNPPNLSKSPQGHYLWAQIPGKIKIVAGLANDELGYIVPGYDFKINHDLIMEPRPKGDHYEETNSVGLAVTNIILDSAKSLLSRVDTPTGKLIK
jgi:hypothetical protein